MQGKGSSVQRDKTTVVPLEWNRRAMVVVAELHLRVLHPHVQAAALGFLGLTVHLVLITAVQVQRSSSGVMFFFSMQIYQLLLL